MATKDTYLSSLMSMIPDIDKANPFEVQRGLDYELVKMGGAVTNETVKKALAKAVKNVMSNPNYYTNLLEDATYELLGMKKPNRKKSSEVTEMEEVKAKDNKAKNQMEKPKVVKESVDLDEKRKNPTDYVMMDVPLFIRMLEFAREDATSDMDLHDVAEKLIKLSAQGKPVTMKSYDSIVAMDDSKEATDEAAKPDFLDLDGDGDKEEPMKKAAKDAKKEDIDLGHQDDEPDMLKGSLYRIAKYAAELYKMLDKYDQMEAEVDFPDWWQEKIHLAKDYMVKAKHYLDFEEKQPSLDAAINEAMMDEKEAIEKFYGDKIQPNTLKLDRSLPGGKYIAKNLKGEDIYFDMGRHHFRVFKVEDWKDFIEKAKGLPVADSEYRSLKDKFDSKKLDYVSFGFPGKQPEMEESLIELTKENINLIKKVVREIMLKKGNSTMVATNLNTINLAKKQGYQPIPGTEDAK